MARLDGNGEFAYHEGQEVGLGVREGELRAGPVAHVAARVDIGFGRLDCKPAVGDRFQLGREALPGVWEVGQNEDDCKSKGNRDPMSVVSGHCLGRYADGSEITYAPSTMYSPNEQ